MGETLQEAMIQSVIHVTVFIEHLLYTRPCARSQLHIFSGVMLLLLRNFWSRGYHGHVTRSAIIIYFAECCDRVINKGLQMHK